MSELPYERLPEPPERLSGCAAIVRLVDGLGFRYRWATDGLTAGNRDFRPGQASMSLVELLAHISALARWVLVQLGGEARPAATDDIEALRERTLADLTDIRERLLAMTDEQLVAVRVATRDSSESFWHLVNGPLADALTHVGQVNAWRRMAGNPTPRADVFRGRPPTGRTEQAGRAD